MAIALSCVKKSVGVCNYCLSSFPVSPADDAVFPADVSLIKII